MVTAESDFEPALGNSKPSITEHIAPRAHKLHFRKYFMGTKIFGRRAFQNNLETCIISVPTMKYSTLNQISGFIKPEDHTTREAHVVKRFGNINKIRKHTNQNKCKMCVNANPLHSESYDSNFLPERHVPGQMISPRKPQVPKNKFSYKSTSSKSNYHSRIKRVITKCLYQKSWKNLRRESRSQSHR